MLRRLSTHKNKILFNLGYEVVLRVPNTDKKISVKKHIVNGKVFGLTQFRTATVLIEKKTLNQMLNN